MKFNPKDFMGHDMSPIFDSPSRYGLEDYQAKRIADIANAKLEEWLKDAPTIEWGKDDYEPTLHPEEFINYMNHKGFKAKLVFIEEIKDE